MNCIIYRSSKKDLTYLYLASGFEYGDLDKGLRNLFGQAEKIMEIELSPDRPLAQEDVIEVMKNLRDRGFHLQMPPREDPSGWLDLKKTTKHDEDRLFKE